MTLWLYSYNPEIFSSRPKDPAEQIITLKTTPYKFYSSIPQILGEQTVNDAYIKSQDIIPELVFNYLKMHDSPMLETADELINTARDYELDPVMLVAIAQCESNLGQKMPHKSDDPYECHNPFGWGIHKGGTLCFDTWQQGYNAVAKGLRENYFNDGLTTPDDIMHRYTPPALETGGSWAKCVNYFMRKINQNQEEILNYSN
jgi:hypothetical protein